MSPSPQTPEDAFSVSLETPAPADHPLRAPLRLVIIGLAAYLAYSAIFVVCVLVMLTSDNRVSIRPAMMVAMFVSLIGSLVLVAGLTQVAMLRRPGHALARAGAVVNSAVALFLCAWFMAPLLPRSESFHLVISFAGDIANGAGIVLVALSLRALAKTRARSFDVLVAVAALAALLELLRFLLSIGEIVQFPGVFIFFVMTALDDVIRIALIAGATAIIATPPLAEHATKATAP
jgi:hypothetical protein